MTDSDNKSRNCPPDNKPDNKEEVGCPWYVNSPEHHNCLWIYIREKSSIDGSMPELVQSEIAQLLGWSNTKTHFMLKQAMAELIEALNSHRGKQLLSSDPDQIVDIGSFSIDPVSSYTSDDSED